MELLELKKQISLKVTTGLYIFTGEEISIMDIYIKELAEVGGTDLVRINTVADMVKMVGNKSIISRPRCYLIRDDKEYATQEKTWENLVKRKIQGSRDIVILAYSTLDKRSKFYKFHEEMIVTFEHLIPSVLAKHIQKKVALSIASAEQLADLCDCDYGRIMMELDKFISYSESMQYNVTETEGCRLSYKHAIEDNLFYIKPKDVVFELVTAFGQRNGLKAVKLQKELEQIIDSPLGFISLLYTQFKNMLLVSGIKTTQDMVGKTGLEYWKIMKLKENNCIGTYSVTELINNLRLVRSVEKDIKVGKIDSALAIDYLLVSIL